MDFATATDRVGSLRVTQADIAEALGIAHSTVRAARLDPDSPNYRQPPEGWERAIAKLARQRGEDLLQLAADLDG